MRNRLLVVAAVLATAAFAQQGRRPAFRTVAPEAQSASGGKAVTGAPYSADEISEHVQTLKDGTHVEHPPVTVKMYRDSAGRTRTERPTLVTIEDPVAQVRYTFALNTADKVAHKESLQTPHAAPAPAPQHASTEPSARPETTTEKLGRQTMEGVTVEGERRTTTWPAGSRGNDQPITMVDEVWKSPELKVAVLFKRNDPLTGEAARRLTNIVRTDPDPSLFHPPADYTIAQGGEAGLQH